MGNYKLLMTEACEKAIRQLEPEVHRQVVAANEKFMIDPWELGTKMEKLKFKDKRLRSIHINDDIRGIITWQKKEGYYVLWWVDHHEKAYEWARRHRVVFDRQERMQLLDINVLSDKKEADRYIGVFSKITDEELMRLGILECLIDKVRLIQTLPELEQHKDDFMPFIYEELFLLATGESVEDVQELYAAQILKVKQDKETYLRQNFIMVDKASDLEKVMTLPLEKWRVMLHPTQRELAYGSAKSPVIVKGSAWTGKTVVAISS